jgi:predicted metalloprotease with PDZ domain
VLPYDEAFGYVGLRVARSVARESHSAGITLDSEDTESLRIGSVRSNSPAEEAGLQEDDEILTVDGKKIKRENFHLVLSRHKQGDRIPITVQRNRQTVRATIVLGPPERFDYRIEEKKDATPEQKALRQAWLRGR